jgi:hypothetical protein
MCLWCHWFLHKCHGMTEKVFCYRDCQKFGKAVRRVTCEVIDPFGQLLMLFLVKCVLFEWVCFEILRYLLIVAMYIIMCRKISRGGAIFFSPHKITNIWWKREYMKAYKNKCMPFFFCHILCEEMDWLPCWL